jgi:CRP-like cAMP-binding protein
VLIHGECAIRKGDADIATVGPGSFLGDMALVARSPRTATVVALSTCTALVIGRESFFQFLRSDPVIATKVLWCFVQVLTDRLARTSSELQLVRAGLASTATEMPIYRHMPPRG